jgi:hypothetical protein
LKGEFDGRQVVFAAAPPAMRVRFHHVSMQIRPEVMLLANCHQLPAWPKPTGERRVEGLSPR